MINLIELSPGFRIVIENSACDTLTLYGIYFEAGHWRDAVLPPAHENCPERQHLLVGNNDEFQSGILDWERVLRAHHQRIVGPGPLDSDHPDLKYHRGERVQLTPIGQSRYPHEGAGTVVMASPRANDPLRPYMVDWDDRKQPNPNSYMEEDLEPIQPKFTEVK